MEKSTEDFKEPLDYSTMASPKGKKLKLKSKY